MDRNRGNETIDEYIQGFPDNVQDKLRELRQLIHEIAPEAQEKISYRIPTFYLNGNLVHFAAFAKHIGFYPTSSGISKFKSELSRYKTSKGTVQFPIEDPLPVELIRNIVRYRVQENTAKKRKK
jgi:uncharacterized protein YdhG (YjbR/CyaY superfamily)